MKAFWGIFCLFYYDAVYCDGFSPYPTVSQRPQIRIGKPRHTIHSEIFKTTTTTREYTHLNSFSASASDSALFPNNSLNNVKQLGKLKAAITKAGMMAYIASMCMALPIVLMPQYLLHKMGLIDRIKKEQMALHAGQFCARWMLRLIPFTSVKTIPYHDPSPQPSIWVCNHVSALDIFMLLATDLKLRGKNKRPMKIVYWKQLEDNPITKLLFQQCGFISVQMTANKVGEANEYDLKSFKTLLKQTKQAFEEGFDIGILPEGQLNPHPEQGLQPCFPGAFTLARMSKRPIHMMALHGTHRLWHGREDIGMTVTGRDVQVRCYPKGRKYRSVDEFLATFEAVIGEFGTTGKDLDEAELNEWLDGTKWEQKVAQEQEQKQEQTSQV